MEQDVFRIFFCRDCGVQTGQVADLFGRDRADSGEACVDRFGDRHGFFFQQACESIRIDGERIGLVHGIRDKVFAAGQDFPHGAHLGGDVFDAVDDLSVRCAEDDIAVFPHDLDDQFFTAQIAQFVQMFDRKMDDPFQFRLPDIDDPSAADVFAKEHAEVRRGHGRRFVCVCQIDKRKRRIRAYEEPPLSVVCFYRKEQFICLGLGDLCDASPDQFISEFVDKVCHDNAVKSHSNPVLSVC